MIVTTENKRVLIWLSEASMFPTLDLSLEDADWLVNELNGACRNVRWTVPE